MLATQPRSSLVNVLSVLSWFSFGTGYDVSKAAAWPATNSIRVRLRDQRTTVTALHVAHIDTDMTAASHAPKADPRDIARHTADAIAAGAPEVLADETTKLVKSKLSEHVSAPYAR
jgi:NAD(P)-dependent dehydrogenase (short-subunit alcohol dehydrogenase family)